MKISIISFTGKGMLLSKKIEEALGKECVEIFTKCSRVKEEFLPADIHPVQKSIGQWTKEQMEQRRAMLFIGACGIAVRAIAPYITDKLHDSAVLVMDEEGKYVIPILSGHVGGANALAQKIADRVEATAVITTATDINRRFAVDCFAMENGLQIVNKEQIAKVSAKVLSGEEITMAIEPGHLSEACRIPEGIQVIEDWKREKADIVIGRVETEHAGLQLRPKEYVIGMGCRRRKEGEKIDAFVAGCLEGLGISADSVFALASIDLKKEERGLLGWCQKRNIPFLTYSAEQLQEVCGEFCTSPFVRDKVGVDNVCERAALKACGNGGYLISKKYAEDGMTIAVAKREWKVTFYET